VISGLGSAGVVTTLAYLTEVSSSEERVSVINRWRLSLMLGNMISSMASISLLYAGSTSLGPFLLDGFTSPVLLSLLLQLVPLVLCFFMRSAPPHAPMHPDEPSYAWRFWKDR
jgi:hypothetical protein